MTSTLQSTKSDAITLKGSAALIGDFFSYGVNSILFQRGVYPYEKFQRQTAYGLPVMMTDDKELLAFIENFTNQLKAWLVSKVIQRVVVVIAEAETQETVERWQFNIECDKTATESTKQTDKPLKDIQKEIKDVIRQIVSSVTFLPHLDGIFSFNILAYTDQDCEVPATWEDGKDHYIANSEEVKFNSFSTLLHKVDMAVCYKVD